MTMQQPVDSGSVAKYRLQIVNNTTRAVKRLDYQFQTLSDAAEILQWMASGGRNEYQVYDIFNDTVVLSSFGERRILH